MADSSANKKRYALALETVKSADQMRNLLRGMLRNAVVLPAVSEILDDYDAKRELVRCSELATEPQGATGPMQHCAKHRVFIPKGHACLACMTEPEGAPAREAMASARLDGETHCLPNEGGFRCPKCGSSYFRTIGDPGKSVLKRQCKGHHDGDRDYSGCSYTWTSNHDNAHGLWNHETPQEPMGAPQKPEQET